MAWFTPSAASDSGARPSLATVIDAASGAPAGGGVLVAPGLVLTCAHVVNDALARPMFTQEPPARARIAVAFPHLAPAGPGSARPVVWVPPRLPGPGRRPAGPQDTVWCGDLALLALDAPPQDVPPVRWKPMARGQSVRSWYGGGQAFTFADGVVEAYDADLGFVDGSLRGAAVGPGYSGGPVWCDDEQAAVGLVLAVMRSATAGSVADSVLRRTVVLPWQAVRRELESAARATGVALPFPPPASAPATAPGAGAARYALAAVVADVLPDTGSRRAAGTYLAGELGLPAGLSEAPSSDELVELLLSTPRALAALTEWLAPTRRAEAFRLLAVGRAALVPGLLSVREYTWLVELLKDRVVLASLPGAVRAALRYTTVWDETGPTGADAADETVPGGAETSLESALRLVERLEGYWGDSAPVPPGTPRVPALLRAVIFLAALCSPAHARQLTRWSNRVADRLGVTQPALDERQAEAADWAASRPSASGVPRLSVKVAAHGDDAYRCTAWYDPGDGEARKVLDDDEPKPQDRLARILHRLLVRENKAAHGRHQDTSVLEFILDADELDLPVDEWGDEPEAADVPVVLGAEYAVVIRCPQLRARAEDHPLSWQRRSAEINRGGFLRLDRKHMTSRQIYGLLKADLSVPRVILDCAEEHRAVLRAVCVLMGVPVVLWERGAAEGSRDRLAALMLNGPARTMPYRVRQQRARALGEAADTGTGPVVIWDDIARPVPEDRWSDPSFKEASP